MHLKSVIAAACAVTLSACASTAPAPTGTPAFDAQRLSDHVKALSDDSFEGRGIATPAEAKVIDYLSREFAAAGFQPGGESGGWTQAVTLWARAFTSFRA
jgi:hypothetical protein